MTANIRNGRGHRMYRRKAQRLKRDTEANKTPCAWCGGQIRFDVPPTHPQSFTADHPIAIANGGHLYQQELKPMCRSCNAKKSDSAPPIIRPAT